MVVIEGKIVITKQTDKERKRLDELAKVRGVIAAGTSSTDIFPPINPVELENLQQAFNRGEITSASICRTQTS